MSYCVIRERSMRSRLGVSLIFRSGGPVRGPGSARWAPAPGRSHRQIVESSPGQGTDWIPRSVGSRVCRRVCGRAVVERLGQARVGYLRSRFACSGVGRIGLMVRIDLYQVGNPYRGLPAERSLVHSGRVKWFSPLGGSTVNWRERLTRHALGALWVGSTAGQP